MPEVTARTPVGAAIQAAKQAAKETTVRQGDPNEVSAPQPEVTNPQDDYAKRIEAMERRERTFRKQQAEFLAEKQRYEQMKSQPQVDPAQERMKLLEELKNRAADDPLAVVSELGMEVHRLRDAQSSAEKFFQEQKAQAEELAKKQIRSAVQTLIDSDPAYEVVKSMGATDAVTELIQLSIQEGEELSVREAAEQVEAYLLDEALKAASIPKIKAKLTPEEKAELKAAIEQQNQTTTLTRTESPSKPLTAKDRRQRAIWAGQGLDPNTGKPFA